MWFENIYILMVGSKKDWIILFTIFFTDQNNHQQKINYVRRSWDISHFPSSAVLYLMAIKSLYLTLEKRTNHINYVYQYTIFYK